MAPSQLDYLVWDYLEESGLKSVADQFGKAKGLSEFPQELEKCSLSLLVPTVPPLARGQHAGRTPVEEESDSEEGSSEGPPAQLVAAVGGVVLDSDSTDSDDSSVDLDASTTGSDSDTGTSLDTSSDFSSSDSDSGSDDEEESPDKRVGGMSVRMQDAARELAETCPAVYTPRALDGPPAKRARRS